MADQPNAVEPPGRPGSDQESNDSIGLSVVVRDALALFDRHIRRRFYRFAIAFAGLAMLDLIALTLVAAALGSGQLDHPASTRVELPQPFRFGAELVGANRTVSLVGIVGIALLIFAARSLLSAWAARRSLVFLGHLDGQLGSDALTNELNIPWIARMQRPRGDVQRDVMDGPSIVVQDFLGSLLLAWGELLTLVAVLVVVAIADPIATTVAVVYFAIIVWVLARRVRKRATIEGRRSFDARSRAIATLGQALDAYKEILVRQRTGAFAARAADAYRTYADARAESEWLYNFARFYLEASLMLGLALVAGAGALVRGTEGAVAVLVLFAAAGFRAVPALHRFQVLSARLRFRGPYVGAMTAILDRQDEASSRHEVVVDEDATERADLSERLEIRDLSITYPGAGVPALRSITLSIQAGTRVAIVGPSGAGKTTLADALLGLLPVPAGSVFVDGIDVATQLREWRRSVGYVPQQVALVDDSIAANIALGWFGADIDEAQAWAALERAHAASFVRALPQGLATIVGEQGVRLSGGERQRIGIARALYRAPRFLVLDEATSSLDFATEAAVTAALADLHGDVTTLVIAHRLATVRDADEVVYLESGTVRTSGSFDEVARAEPSFAENARLAGLAARID